MEIDTLFRVVKCSADLTNEDLNDLTRNIVIHFSTTLLGQLNCGGYSPWNKQEMRLAFWRGNILYCV
jgi:hypothetical protein